MILSIMVGYTGSGGNVVYRRASSLCQQISEELGILSCNLTCSQACALDVDIRQLMAVLWEVKNCIGWLARTMTATFQSLLRVRVYYLLGRKSSLYIQILVGKRPNLRLHCNLRNQWYESIIVRFSI
jgi:hypothetical protein